MKKLSNCWQLDGVEAQIQHIRVPGRDGMAGAVGGELIPFHPLSNPF